MSARAEPRTTRDVDIAVDVTDDADAEALVAELRVIGFEVLARVSDGGIAVRRRAERALCGCVGYARCPGEGTPMDDAEQAAMAPAFPHTADWIGFVGGLFPFVFSYRETHSINGEVVSSIDWVAIAGGGAALVAAIFTLALFRRTPTESRTKRVAATLALAGLALVQLVFRGFGFL
ncbi:MAG: hypothetical protein M3Y87_12830 [Myxococcota bacterium]|nr:hypothetical protein [Myxococcota bacterium]